MTGNLAIANGHGYFESGLFNGYGYLKMTAINGDETTRIQIETGENRRPFIETTVGGAKKTLEVIATATPPQEYDLQLTDGIEPADTVSNAHYCKTQDNMVVLNVSLKSTKPISEGSTIATLPSGYRPNRTLHLPIQIMAEGYSISYGHMDIGQNGALSIWSMGENANKIIRSLYCGTVSFLATH